MPFGPNVALFDFHLEIEAVSIASDGRIIAWTLLVLMGADPSTAVNENWSHSSPQVARRGNIVTRSKFCPNIESRKSTRDKKRGG